MDLAVGALAAAGCGVAALGVPALVRALPGPAGDVAAVPGFRSRAVLLSAVAGGLVGGAVGAAWPLLFLLPLVPVGVALGLVDATAHLLPTRLIWPSLAVTAVLAAVVALVEGDGRAYATAVAAAVIVLVIFHVLWWIQPEGMGYGDVRLAVLVAFALGYLGLGAVAIGVYGAFVVFALVGMGRAVVRRDRRALREALPFGPFLLVGALVATVLTGGG